MLLVYIRESRFQAAILKADDVEGYGAAADSARERGYVRKPHFVFVLNVWVKGHILHVRARAWHNYGSSGTLCVGVGELQLQFHGTTYIIIKHLASKTGIIPISLLPWRGLWTSRP